MSQLSLAVILLAGAGLLIKSFRQLKNVDPGFQKEDVLVAELILPFAQYTQQEELRSFYEAVLRNLRGLPGVTGAALAYDHPLQTTWFEGFRFLDRPEPEPGEGPDARFRLADAAYFETMDIRLVSGRTFTRADRDGAPGVVVVNEAFVRKYLPTEDPLTVRIGHATGAAIWGARNQEVTTSFQIVGVVEDVRFAGLREPPEAAFYLPLRQFPYWAFHLFVRYQGDPTDLLTPLRRGVWDQDPNLPVPTVETMEDVFQREVAQDRFNTLLLSVFAVAALLLAAGGIYGVTAYAVARRTGEIGIRMALGADRPSVMRMVMGETLAMAGWSLGLGLVGGVALGRVFSSMLFGVRPLDLPVLLAATGALLSAALISGYFPARRAARAEPMHALRVD